MQKRQNWGRLQKLAAQAGKPESDFLWEVLKDSKTLTEAAQKLDMTRAGMSWQLKYNYPDLRRRFALKE